MVPVRNIFLEAMNVGVLAITSHTILLQNAAYYAADLPVVYCSSLNYAMSARDLLCWKNWRSLALDRKSNRLD
jgi:hypothetical protein